MTLRRPSRSRAALPALVLATGLVLTACTQPDPADDIAPQPDPAQPSDTIRTPAPVESAPSAVPLPGESNSPDVGGDQPSPGSS